MPLFIGVALIKHNAKTAFKFSLNVFTKFRKFRENKFVITAKGFKPSTSTGM